MGHELVERPAKWARGLYDQRRVRWDRISADVLVLHRHEHQCGRLHIACREPRGKAPDRMARGGDAGSRRPAIAARGFGLAASVRWFGVECPDTASMKSVIQPTTI